MSKRFRIATLVTTLCLCLSMLVVGVLAATTASFSVTSNLTFKADGVYVMVDAKLKQGATVQGASVVSGEGAPSGNSTYKAYSYKKSISGDYPNGEPYSQTFLNASGTSAGDWTIGDINFTKTNKVVVYEFAVSNYSEFEVGANITENLQIELQQYIEQNILTLQTYVGDTATSTPSFNFTIPARTSETTPGTQTYKIVVTLNSYTASFNTNQIEINFEFAKVSTVQVTNVSLSGATTGTYNDLTGGRELNDIIDLSGITFKTGETTITIPMKSNSDKYIKNIVSYDSGAVTYNTTGTSGTTFVHSTSLYLPNNSSESKDLKIYVNNNSGSPKTISGLKVSFEEKESLLQADTTNNYWYIEMGTIMGQTQSEYIRWKYIASVDDRTGSDVATKYSTFNANTKPTGQGYFLLETDVLTAIGKDGTNNMIEVSFNNDYTNSSTSYHNLNGWTNVLANDYATSNVRQYINGYDSYDSYTGSGITGYTPDGRYSNMYTDLNIDIENDIIYKQIVTRALGDLYQDNTNSTTNPTDVPFPDLSGADVGYKYQSTDEDKFWLLSYYEVYNLVGSSSLDRIWPTGSANIYWLRSPYLSISRGAYFVDTSGSFLYNYVNSSSFAARCAFKFSI